MRNTSIYTQITPAVLQTIKSKYNNYDNTLFSFIEISHRSEEYLNLSNRTVEKLKTYFNAEQYICLLMPTGVAISSIYFNLPHRQYYFYISGQFSQKCYKQMQKYDGRAKMLSAMKEIEVLFEYIAENQCEIVIHTNQVDNGRNIKFPKVPINIAKYVTVIKNMNYCFPCNQDYKIEADIGYLDSQTGLSTPGFTIIFIKQSLISQLIQGPSCPDMFSYKRHYIEKSVVNTPFTLCTLVLCQNVEYNLQNRLGILERIKNNKKQFKRQSVQYQKLDLNQQSLINEQQDNLKDAETMVTLKLDNSSQENKKEIEDKNYGWKLGQNIFSFYIQILNTNFLNFISTQ